MIDKECWATFTCAGGYDFEQAQAKKVFKVGERYKIIGGEMGRSYTKVFFEGVEEGWNSVLFDYDKDIAPIKEVWRGVSREIMTESVKSFPAEMDGNTYFNETPEKQSKICHLTVSMDTKEILEVLARASNMTLDEYVVWVLKEKAAEILNN